MPQGLLVLPLLGGFLLLHLTHLFRFRAQRYDGYRLLMASAVAGAVLLLLGRLLVLLFGAVPWLGPAAGSVWFGLSPFPHSDTCAWAVLLGPLMAIAINRVYGVDAAKDRQVERNKEADAFTRFLHVASRENRMVSLTMDNRKWYVGYIAEAPNLFPGESHFRLIPLMSGYRDKDTLETFRTVFYEEVLSTKNASDFVITMRMSDVKSASFFDPDIYDEFFGEDG